MQRERVSENVYWFQSEIYAQVTAGVIVGPQWAVVVDTLAMPEESQIIRKFVLEDLGLPIRYLINTHSHSDHAWGNCFFPGTTIVSHTLCAELLRTRGVKALAESKKYNQTFQNNQIVVPHLTFSHGDLTLKIGKKNLILMLTPGHTSDGISVFVEEDRVFFAGDAFMPIPQMEEGNSHSTMDVIKKIGDLGLENIIQGHGDIILRGEIEDAVNENIAYIEKIRDVAQQAVKHRDPASFLNQFNIESCGKSRVYLGGLAEQLHRNNLIHMFKEAVAEIGLPQSDDEYIDDYDDDDFDDLLFTDYTDSLSISPDDEPDDFYSNSKDIDDDDF